MAEARQALVTHIGDKLERFGIIIDWFRPGAKVTFWAQKINFFKSGRNLERSNNYVSHVMTNHQKA